MTRRVDPAELYAGTVAFNQNFRDGVCDCYGDGPIYGGTCPRHGQEASSMVIEAVIEAVIPIIEERQRAITERQASSLVAIIVAAQGGRLHLTAQQLTQMPQELIRWDDPTDQSIVFATKEAALADPERADPFHRAG